MKKIIFFLCFLLGGIITSSAQNDYFLKLEGIEGDSNDAAHAKWIDIDTFSRGVQRAKASATGQSRRQGAATFIDLCITKKVDVATVPIEFAAVQGKAIPKAILEITRNVGGARKVYLKYELENVSVTNYGINGEEPDVPIDSFCLSFTKIKVTYTSYDQRGVKSGEKTYEWDIKRNSPN